MAQPPSRRTLANLRLRLGTFLVEIGDSRLRAVVAIAAVGAAAGFVEYIIHETLRRSTLAQSLGGLMDASIVGLAAATVTAISLFAARERRKRVLHEVRKIAELNHNVRNALQVIVHSHYGLADDHTGMVLDSVERIERTLEELFPIGKPKDEEKRRRTIPPNVTH